MSRTPTIFGISMSARKRRRLLVLFCYAIWGLLMLSALFSRSEPARFLLPLANTYAFLFIVFGVFYRLAGDIVFPMEDQAPISLGLSRKSFPNGKKLDERQVAIRNAAYYKAYRLIVAFVLLMPIILPVASNRMLLATIISLMMALLFSLPQAIILWTEPDMPNETG